MLTADQIRALLKLEPHPIEGGYFVETYQSALRIPKALLPEDYPERPGRRHRNLLPAHAGDVFRSAQAARR